MANNIVYSNDGEYGSLREGQVGPLMQAQAGVVMLFTLRDLTNTAIDISGYTVTGKLKNRNTAVVGSITGATVVTGSAASGEFSWTTHANDVAEDGTYLLWFTLTKASSPTFVTLPLEMEIRDDEAVGGSFVSAGGVTVAMAEWLEAASDINATTGNFASWDANDELADSGYSATDLRSETLRIVVGDETTALSNGTAKVTFRMPWAMTLTAVRASVTTAPTGSTIIVDINEGGVSILSTKLTIDDGEKTSVTAATPAVISDANLADDAEMTIDIDQRGASVAGAGLKVTLIGTRA